MKFGPEYSFLSEPPLDHDNIILLGLGGSHAYGTNVETSDLDIRGIATNSAPDILTRKGFEQVVNEATDTTIYSLEKIISLLSNCNPNTIELLGLEPDQYFKITKAGQSLLDNRDMFLSKRAINSFRGYATAQLRRLENKSARTASQSRQEEHILNSIENSRYSFKDKYFGDTADSINLYIDKAVNPDYDTEIFMDVSLTHYPLRDYKSMWSEMNEVVKSYAKVGRRNQHAIDHDKLGKHMMHLVRLYLMCFDILEKGEIITYRKNDIDFLMSIRNGYYLDENNQVKGEFYQIVDKLEAKLHKLKETTKLPANPDYKRINQFLMETNLEVIKKWEVNK